MPFVVSPSPSHVEACNIGVWSAHHSVHHELEINREILGSERPRYSSITLHVPKTMLQTPRKLGSIHLLAPLFALLKMRITPDFTSTPDEVLHNRISVQFVHCVLISLDCPLRRVQLWPIDLMSSCQRRLHAQMQELQLTKSVPYCHMIRPASSPISAANSVNNLKGHTADPETRVVVKLTATKNKHALNTYGTAWMPSGLRSTNCLADPIPAVSGW